LLSDFSKSRICDSNRHIAKAISKLLKFTQADLNGTFLKSRQLTLIDYRVSIMARRKRTSQVLEKAVRRAAGMSSIDSALDLGNGLSLPAFSTLIETMRSRENDYNSALSNLDRLYREMLQTERELADMAEHMLLGVATRYGKSSVEYGMAGGVPKNQRRKGLRGEASIPGAEQPTVILSVNNTSRNGSQNGKTGATNA
jgi:hypothetical protein